MIASLIECINNLKANYKVEIIGASAAVNEVLPLFLNDLVTEGLHLGNITIKLCGTECQLQSNDSSNTNEDDIKVNLPAFLIAISLMLLNIIIIVILAVLIACYCKRLVVIHTDYTNIKYT